MNKVSVNGTIFVKPKNVSSTAKASGSGFVVHKENLVSLEVAVPTHTSETGSLAAGNLIFVKESTLSHSGIRSIVVFEGEEVMIIPANYVLAVQS